MQVNTAFVGTVFVPNDAGALLHPRANPRNPARAAADTAAAWATFLRAARLTQRELLANAPLLDKLARQHVVPHVRAHTCRRTHARLRESCCTCAGLHGLTRASRMLACTQVALRTIDFTPGAQLATLSQEVRPSLARV